MSFGPWLMPAFKVLAKLKFLRSTAFDPFGRSLERRTERALIRDYEAMLDDVLARLTPDLVEAAALAASQITDAELDELADLVEAIEVENETVGGTHRADRAFHTVIARVTRNNAILETIDRLWEQRERSAESALLDAKDAAVTARALYAPWAPASVGRTV